MPKQHPITSDALAVWRFDQATGDIPDLSGNGNTATGFGTVPAQSGQFGTCRGSFSASDYFTASASPSLKPTVFTYAYWAYWASSAQADFAKIAGYEESGDTSNDGMGQLNTSFGGSGLRTSVKTGPSDVVFITLSGSPVSVGWHHVGLTLDEDGLCKGYFDGQLVDTGQITGTPYYDNSGWWFGRDAHFPAQAFDGWIEDIAVYSKVKDICWFSDIADSVLPAPVLSLQSPAPGATLVEPSPSISFQVSQPTFGVSLSSVQVFVNDSLSFSRSRHLSGVLESSVSEVTNGHALELKVAGDLEPGLQTVRVVAGVCPGGTELDESWAFTSTVAPSENVETIQDDPTSGIDLLLSSTDRDITVSSADLQLVTGVDEVVQHLGVGLRLYRGEWFLDSESGIPYYAYILVNSPNTRVIEGLFRRDIIGDSDIEELSSLTLELDRATRKLEIDFTAKSRVGVVSVSSVFP